ncbi:hypothetical protein HPB50_028698 [Hyalomma asiaticum]|nr:hypothetical protein HPB50_028698 [Hyalomma asiaticum]
MRVPCKDVMRFSAAFIQTPFQAIHVARRCRLSAAVFDAGCVYQTRGEQNTATNEHGLFRCDLPPSPLEASCAIKNIAGCISSGLDSAVALKSSEPVGQPENYVAMVGSLPEGDNSTAALEIMTTPQDNSHGPTIR